MLGSAPVAVLKVVPALPGVPDTREAVNQQHPSARSCQGQAETRRMLLSSRRGGQAGQPQVRAGHGPAPASACWRSALAWMTSHAAWLFEYLGHRCSLGPAGHCQPCQAAPEQWPTKQSVAKRRERTYDTTHPRTAGRLGAATCDMSSATGHWRGLGEAPDGAGAPRPLLT